MSDDIPRKHMDGYFLNRQRRRKFMKHPEKDSKLRLHLFNFPKETTKMDYSEQE